MNNNTKAIVIVHGKSELAIAQFVKSNLRLPIEIISRNKGRNSIQIDSLYQELTDSRFKNINNFKRYFPLVKFEKKRMVQCKIFPIMDLDDTALIKQEQYKDKSMFHSYWFKEEIIPIYNDPCLEETLKNIGYKYAEKKSAKGSYVSIFPTADSKGSDKTQIENFAAACKKSKKTNMDVFLEYCLAQVNPK